MNCFCGPPLLVIDAHPDNTSLKLHKGGGAAGRSRRLSLLIAHLHCYVVARRVITFIRTTPFRSDQRHTRLVFNIAPYFSTSKGCHVATPCCVCILFGQCPPNCIIHKTDILAQSVTRVVVERRRRVFLKLRLHGHPRPERLCCVHTFAQLTHARVSTPRITPSLPKGVDAAGYCLRAPVRPE